MPYNSIISRTDAAGARADDGDRTRDPQLGKLMLYQLSYVRVPFNDSSAVRLQLFAARSPSSL